MTNRCQLLMFLSRQQSLIYWLNCRDHLTQHIYLSPTIFLLFVTCRIRSPLCIWVDCVRSDRQKRFSFRHTTPIQRHCSRPFRCPIQILTKKVFALRDLSPARLTRSQVAGLPHDAPVRLETFAKPKIHHFRIMAINIESIATSQENNLKL